jgi:hypothetical protein
MGLVVALADWSKNIKPREPFEGSAKIIIFNGVRFERLHDEPQLKAHKRRLPSGHNQAVAEELE